MLLNGFHTHVYYDDIEDHTKEYIFVLGLLLFIHKIMFIFQAFAFVAYAQEGSKCVSVNPVPSFDYAKFEGMW